jgi:tetratricopeptide (TPR) repeat protein
MLVSTAALACAGVIAVSNVTLAAGALAVDPENPESYGFAIDYNWSDDARAAAVKKCSSSNCKVVVQFGGTCAAYARDQSSGAYGIAFTPNKGQVQNMALASCQKNGGTACTVRVWACESRILRDNSAWIFDNTAVRICGQDGVPPDTRIAACSVNLESILFDNRNRAMEYFNRGIAYAEKKDYNRALADYGEAIRLYPQDANAKAFNNRGKVYYAQGNLDAALADFNEAIQFDPQYANAFNNRGFAKKKMGDAAGAEADFATARAIQPDIAQ